jgi:uncharacterized protein (DUF427 family)
MTKDASADVAPDVSRAHRIEITPGMQHVRVSDDGVLLAETRSPVLLNEGSLPTRYYIDPADVRLELLTPTDTTTHCPFKGDATYWSTDTVTDAAWSYREPIPGAEAIAGLICFFNEKVDIDVDGRRQDRPRTRWS